MAREAGAKKVYFASAAPPVKYPNVYGIDISTKSELIANHCRTEDEIAKVLNADKIIYNDLNDIISSVISLNPLIKALDCACFDGHYVTGDITQAYLDRLESNRGSGRTNATTTTTATTSSLTENINTSLIVHENINTNNINEKTTEIDIDNDQSESNPPSPLPLVRTTSTGSTSNDMQLGNQSKKQRIA